MLRWWLLAASLGIGCTGEEVWKGEEAKLAFSGLLHTMVMHWFLFVVVLFYEWPLNTEILPRIASWGLWWIDSLLDAGSPTSQELHDSCFQIICLGRNWTSETTISILLGSLTQLEFMAMEHLKCFIFVCFLFHVFYEIKTRQRTW